MISGEKEAMPSGLKDPVFDSQSIFRSVLLALSRPGKVATVTSEITPPSPLHPATAGIALSLFDQSTPYWIDPSIRTKEVVDFIRFYSGARITEDPSQAAFAIVEGAGSKIGWDKFAIGTPEYPDRSTTIVAQVADFQEGGTTRLTGPGIQSEHMINVTGLSEDYWSARRQNATLYPLGTDTILVAQYHLLCLPRTTQVEI